MDPYVEQIALSKQTLKGSSTFMLIRRRTYILMKRKYGIYYIGFGIKYVNLYYYFYFVYFVVLGSI
jgi:hypothetical protein